MDAFVAALKGAAGFRSHRGRLALQHPLEVGVLSPPQSVGFIGALVSSFARWAQCALGIVPRSVLCAAGGGAAVWRLAGSRIGQTVGKESDHMAACAYRSNAHA